MPQIVSPFPCIAWSVSMIVCPMTMSFIIFPLALIGISICIDYTSFPICSVVLPVPFIKWIVLPNLFTFSMSFSVFKLPNIFLAFFEANWAFLDKSYLFRIIDVKVAQLLSYFLSFLIIKFFWFICCYDNLGMILRLFLKSKLLSTCVARLSHQLLR